jgi:hypothetical protein
MGSKAPTTSSSTAAPAWLQQNLQSVQGRAQDIASTPYQAYNGQLTAGLNPTQAGAISGVSGAVGASVPYYQQGAAQAGSGFDTTRGASDYFRTAAQGVYNAEPYYQQASGTIGGAQPYYGQATNYATQSAGPLDISKYLNPYQQSVIDTTMAQQQRQDSIAQNGALSTAIQGGNAFGGDRMGVAAAQMASDQSRNRASTLAGLNSANYTQALGAAQADAARYGQAANMMSNLGNAQINAGTAYGNLAGSKVNQAAAIGTLGNGVVNQGSTMSNQGTQIAGLGQNYQNGVISANNAALAAGTVGQQTDQAGLNAAYQQYLNQTSFPYQQTSWLSNIINGGSGAAGATTTSTGSAPNVFGQVAGGALALGSLGTNTLGGGFLSSLFKSRGGVVPRRASGGVVQAGLGFPMAGGPIDMNGTPYAGGGLIPTITINPSHLNAPAAIDPNKGQGGSQDMSKGLAGLSNGWLGQSRPTYGGASSAMGDPTGIGGLYASGGVVPRGYADGGVPNFDDRWAPVNDALGNFTFQPGQMVSPGLVPSAPPPQPSTPLGPTDPNAAPFRLDGSYRDQPENIAPLNEMQAESRFAGNDEPAPGLGLPPEIARGMSRPAPQQDSPVMAYDAPRGLVPPSYAPPAQNAGVAPQPASNAPSDSLVGKLFGVGDDGRQALLSLGLGLLANRSPNFGTALGEAGLGAVGTLNEIHKQRTTQAEKDRAFALEKHRAENEDARLKQSLEDARRAAMASPLIPDGKGGVIVNSTYVALKRAEASASADNRLLPGYRAKSDGSLEFIPGGPTDPEVIKRRAEAENKKDGPDELYNQRKAVAERAGLKESDSAYKSFMLTGKMPREDQAPLSATDKKAILEADEHVMTTQATIDSLKRAKDLSKKAYEGPYAGARGYATSLLGVESGVATEDLTNEITTNALSSLKSIFGGNPTEGERAILLDIQGSVSKPDIVRQKIFDRAIKAADRRLDFNKQRASEMRGGDYYKSDAKKSTSPTSPALQNATPKVGEKKQFKQGTGIWNGQSWVPEGAQ